MGKARCQHLNLSLNLQVGTTGRQQGAEKRSHLRLTVPSGTAPQCVPFHQQQAASTAGSAHTGKTSHKAGIAFRDEDLIFCQQH